MNTKSRIEFIVKEVLRKGLEENWSSQKGRHISIRTMEINDRVRSQRLNVDNYN